MSDPSSKQTKREPRVFVSATSSDLRTIRDLIKNTLLTAGCHPVVQEHFRPDYRKVEDMLKDRLRTCDALIHVVGMRYGCEPKKRSGDQPRRSYTQMEYYTAKEMGLEVYTFICPDDFPYHQPEEGSEKESDELCQLQLEHRKRLLDSDNLYTEVEKSDEVEKLVLQLEVKVREVPDGERTGKNRVLPILALVIGLGAAGFALFGSYGPWPVAILDPQARTSEDVPQSMPLGLEWNLIAQRKLGDGTVTAFPIADGATLPSGDQIRILARVSQDCCLYIVGQGPDGRIVGLYPNLAAGQDSRVKGGEMITLPDDKGIWLQLDNETGEEIIYLIASTDFLPDLERLKTETVENSDQLRGLFQTRGMRQALSLEGSKVETTLSSGRSVAVPLQTLLSDDGNCTAKITFSHGPVNVKDQP